MVLFPVQPISCHRVPDSSLDGFWKLFNLRQTPELRLVHLEAAGGAVSAACCSVTSPQSPPATVHLSEPPVEAAAGGCGAMSWKASADGEIGP